MSKSYFMVILVLLMAISSLAQIRHVKGIKSVEAGYGMNAYGSQYYAGYVMYFSNKLYAKGNLFYGTMEKGNSKMNTMGIDLSPAFTVFPIGESVYLNIRPGATLSYDKLSSARTIYEIDGSVRTDDYGVLKYGVFLGIEPEIFISDKFVLVLGFSQRYTFGKKIKNSTTGDAFTTFGNSRWFATAGIRYNF